MSKLKFTPDDFNEHETKEYLARCAQQIFDEWVEKQTVVYGKNNRPHYQWDDFENEEHTHKARLVCVEELKPCEHEPHEFWADPGRLHVDLKCKKCGTSLRPKWEPA